MKNIRIMCIGNYPPRQCGIATFTRNFSESIVNNTLEKNVKSEVRIIALNEQVHEYSYPEEVTHVINKNHINDYIEAVNYINFSNSDICVLQHEFGIYGGDSGVFILPLINRLKIPLVVIMHTVLKEPSYDQRNIIIEIGRRADKIVVMNQIAVDILNSVYSIPLENIEVIEHGVPDFNFTQNNYNKHKFHVEKKKTLLTFGLLSRNKGIETVINALPMVVERHPEVLYIVLGKTHPSVAKVSGEEYRNYLKLLVRKNNLSRHVYFDDQFVSTNELLSYLSAADIYITPYLEEAQITSGTLSYAVGAGAAVISTPYWHAKSLLADGRGRLFDFHDSDALADIINELLDNPDELNSLRKKAYAYGRKTIWPEIGKKYIDLITNVVESYSGSNINEEPIINQLLLPKFNLEHVKRMTDSTGILQHAKYNIPRFKEGYCLDDNSRALLMTTLAYKQMKSPEALDLMPFYLSYIQYMQNNDGTFRNFLSFERKFLDKQGSEDSFGRTIWALGELVRFPPNDAYYELTKEMFAKAYPNFNKLKFLRGIANTTVGICSWISRFPWDEGMVDILNKLTDKITAMYEKHSSDEWQWFEPELSYDNGIIPLALFSSYKITKDAKVLDIAEKTLNFLEQKTFRDGYLSLIGNDGWYKKDGKKSDFDQQPIDAMAMVLMYHKAFEVTKKELYLKNMFSSFMWFLGENDLCIPIYDFQTHGCNDGLKKTGVNRNQGAESTLAYLIAKLTVLSGT
ncbi:MAG: glycosyltransferase family 4 protein [Spirochaetales bacterium]|uniref:Glycosyltransferase family 4 protein n=1 Tax=Candidatus Thalassospirochaeta sargassi TaxID=3119039 RepID=A0AAJ1IK89_9SPIO|nr:glycosyltransferase family 4 protein [Spirochaetales bacterium]